MKITEEKELNTMAQNKLEAIKATMRKYPAMSEARAKFYVEEILGYFKD